MAALQVLSRDELAKLCSDARQFWSDGPWLVSELTECHIDRYVVPFHFAENPAIEAIATPEIVQAALSMDVSAIETLNDLLCLEFDAAVARDPTP